MGSEREGGVGLVCLPFAFDYCQAFYVLPVDFGSLSERLGRGCEGNLNVALQRLGENTEWLLLGKYRICVLVIGVQCSL